MTYLSRQASNRFFRQGKVCWAVLFVLLAMLASCSKEVRQPLRIATNHWTGYKPFYLAQEIGHLPKESFQFFSLPNATGVLNAFRNGLVNVAALTLDEAILLKSQGVDIHIVAILDTSNGADVIMATPDIKSPADLKGKRIGMETGAVGAFMLSRMLERQS